MNRRRIFLFSLALLAGIGHPAGAAPRQQKCSPNTTVSLPQGTVCGLTTVEQAQNVNLYLGIPYAAPPVVKDASKCEGATVSDQCLRWKAPQPALPWASPLAATRFGAECVQPDANENLVGQEDCLFLNVYAPQGAPGWPVMVYIHGGAFFEGSASTELFDGASLAAAGNVVVVDFNYRLGAFGFLVATDANPSHSLTGNYGFLDQQQALAWVRDNIAKFGGDPSRVTIFGESAGAMSVGLHMVSAPRSRRESYFRAGIMQSNPLAIPYQTPQQAAATGRNLAEALGCQNRNVANAVDVACLYQLQPPAILAQQVNVSPPTPSLTWAPVVDGQVIDSQPLAALGANKLPLLFGTNHDEGFFFVFNQAPFPIPPSLYPTVVDSLFGPLGKKVAQHYPCDSRYSDCRWLLAQLTTEFEFTCANRHVAQEMIHQQGAKAPFGYWFEVPSGFRWPLTPNCSATYPCYCQDVVCHGAELPYVFNTAQSLDHCGADGKSPCSFDAGQQQLSQLMGHYWSSFAEKLEPAGPVAWPTYPRYAHFLADSSSGILQQTPADPFQSPCCFWEGLGIYGDPAPGCPSASPPQKWGKKKS